MDFQARVRSLLRKDALSPCCKAPVAHEQKLRGCWYYCPKCKKFLLHVWLTEGYVKL
jgi:hypothetical protein